MHRIVGAAIGLGLAVWGAVALADDRGTIVASCGQTLNLPAGACDCIADKAMSEFNEAEFAFFMAVITSDSGAQTKLRGDMTVNELTHVGMRMGQMPGECARG
jgi:hypothetical protein